MDNQSFIQQNVTKSLPEIALQLSKHPELDKEFIINQINGIQKAKNKLPEFYQNPNIIYPSTISIEQCSSEQTAIYKSKILRHSGQFHPERSRRVDPESSIIDLTGGFGVDSFYFSKKFKSITYIEPNQQLLDVVAKNFDTLKANNINCVHSTAEEFLKKHTQKFDIAYIDPSRRNQNQKVFLLKDCIPNIVDLQDEILKIAKQILVKTSPILDIKQSLKELKNVSNVWVVSLDNECKEVLYLLEDKTTSNPKINTVNILSSTTPVILSGEKTQEFSFDFETEEYTNIEYSNPLNYLYEPNTSILKAGAFKSIAHKFGLQKLAANTHLYTSDKLVKDFPGRSFEIKNVLPYQTKLLKKIGVKKVNVSCRNFPESVAQVKKKLNLNDGGTDYLFATTDRNNKPLLILTNKA